MALHAGALDASKARISPGEEPLAWRHAYGQAVRAHCMTETSAHPLYRNVLGRGDSVRLREVAPVTSSSVVVPALLRRTT